MNESSHDIIPFSEDRIVRVYAQITSEYRSTLQPGVSQVIGQLIRELKDVELWKGPVGNIVNDSDGLLWLERASLDTTGYPVPIPDCYLASSLQSLKQMAALHFDAAKLAFVPRSQQWKFAKAFRAFDDWLRANDARCLDDPGSYWNESRSPDF